MGTLKIEVGLLRRHIQKVNGIDSEIKLDVVTTMNLLLRYFLTTDILAKRHVRLRLIVCCTCIRKLHVVN